MAKENGGTALLKNFGRVGTATANYHKAVIASEAKQSPVLSSEIAASPEPAPAGLKPGAPRNDKSLKF